MENTRQNIVVRLLGNSVGYARRYLFRALSIGPVPDHLALILDGNRRYARKWKLEEGMGHKAGFLSLLSLMKYSYELGVKYVTVYAFSIDNFKRKPQEVDYLMDLMLEKIEELLKEEHMANKYGIRVHFIGNLNMLNERVRLAAEAAMKATRNNDKTVLFICVAYSSTDEILHAAQESCEEIIKSSVASNGDDKKQHEDENGVVIKLSDIERHMYMGVAPDPDILIRTSGETRLSNFLLWQTSNSLLYAPKALWPEFGLSQLVWAVFNFQRMHPYLETTRNQL